MSFAAEIFAWKQSPPGASTLLTGLSGRHPVQSHQRRPVRSTEGGLDQSLSFKQYKYGREGKAMCIHTRGCDQDEFFSLGELCPFCGSKFSWRNKSWPRLWSIDRKAVLGLRNRETMSIKTWRPCVSVCVCVPRHIKICFFFDNLAWFAFRNVFLQNVYRKYTFAYMDRFRSICRTIFR